MFFQCADFPYIEAFCDPFFPSCYFMDFKDPKGERREEQQKIEDGN